jgi:hypothetical protein
MTAVASDDSLDQHARTEQMKAARGPSVHTHRSSSTRWRRSGARWPPRLFRAPGGECAGRPAGGQLQREPQWVFIRKCGLDVLGAMVAMGFVATLI